MITSESAGVEFRRFLFRYEQDLVDRVYGLIMKKYRRTIIPILKKGGDLPTIFGKVKIDDNPSLTRYFLTYFNIVFQCADKLYV